MAANPAEPVMVESPPEGYPAFAWFLTRLHSMDSVKRVAASWTGAQVNLWVVLKEDVPEDFDRIFSLEYDLRRAVGADVVTVDVVTAELAESIGIPPEQTVFARS